MNLSGYVGPAPSAGMVIDIINYPNSTDPYLDILYKQVHSFFGKQLHATSGINNTSFQVAPSAIGYFHVGLPVILHDDGFTNISAEQIVQTIDNSGNIVTVAGPLGYSPASGCLIDLIGFPDGGGNYRWA